MKTTTFKQATDMECFSLYHQMYATWKRKYARDHQEQLIIMPNYGIIEWKYEMAMQKREVL